MNAVGLLYNRIDFRRGRQWTPAVREWLDSEEVVVEFGAGVERMPLF